MLVFFDCESSARGLQRVNYTFLRAASKHPRTKMYAEVQKDLACNFACKFLCGGTGICAVPCLFFGTAQYSTYDLHGKFDHSHTVKSQHQASF